MALGVGVLVYFALPTEPSAEGIWLAPPLIALACWLGARRPLAGWALGLLAAAAAGFALAAWHTGRQPPPLDPPRTAIHLSGRVSAVELLPEGRRITLEAPRFGDAPPEARAVRVRLKPGDAAAPRPGDTLRVRALLRAPAPPAYPGAWDFQRAAFFSGLGASGFALGPAEVIAGPAGAPAFASLRAGMEARVAAALPGAPGAIAAALLTGTQTAIPAAELAAMRDSGLAHLLSVSGLHIAIVMGCAFGLIRLALAAIPALALRLPVKALAALAALGVGGLYLLLSGSQVPMLRSFAMAALATLALLAGRRALSLRSLALAGAVVMVLQPAAVLGASFQMSFAAVLALIAGWEWLRPRLPSQGRHASWQRRLALAGFGILATSLLAGAATLPFGLHHFGRLQLYGTLANAIAVPVTSVLVMPAGMLAALLMPFGLEQLALVPMGWGVAAILWVAHQVAALPGAALQATPIPAWGLAVSALGLLWLCLWGSRWRLAGVPLLAIGLASGAWAAPPDALVSADGRLILLRAGEAPFLQRQSGASALVRDSWARLDAGRPATALPREGEAAAGRLACTRGACTLAPGAGRPSLILLRGDPAEAACAAVPLILSAEPVRGRCAAQVVDRFAVWRNGPHAIWLDPAGVRVVSDRAVRGSRPWVPPPPLPRGTASSDPPAATE